MLNLSEILHPYYFEVPTLTSLRTNFKTSAIAGQTFVKNSENQLFVIVKVQDLGYQTVLMGFWLNNDAANKLTDDDAVSIAHSCYVINSKKKLYNL